MNSKVHPSSKNKGGCWGEGLLCQLRYKSVFKGYSHCSDHVLFFLLQNNLPFFLPLLLTSPWQHMVWSLILNTVIFTDNTKESELASLARSIRLLWFWRIKDESQICFHWWTAVNTPPLFSHANHLYLFGSLMFTTRDY